MNRTNKITKLINELKRDYYLNNSKEEHLKEYKNDDYQSDLIFNDLASTIEFSLITSKEGEHILSFYGLELPHCCGVLEIGSIRVISEEHAKNLQSLTDCNILLGVVKFMDIIALSKYTLIINTIPNLKVLEKALTLSKSWKLVRENVNPNSNNLIKTWINK